MIEFEELLFALNELESIVVVTDTSGLVRYVNNAFIDKYGYTRSEIIGQSTRILNANYHKVSFYKDMWNTLNGGDSWEGIFLNKAKNGRLIWERSKISPIKKNGKIDGFIAIKDDITYKKQLEEEFRKEKFLLDELFENSPSGVVIFEAKNNKESFEELLVLKSNPTANQIFQQNSLEGLNLNRFLSDFRFVKNTEVDMLLYKNTTEAYFQSINKHLKIISFPLDKDGYCMFIHDVTDYKSAIEAKAKSELRYAKLVEDAPALIRRFDINGILSYVNSYYATYLNSDTESLLGSNVFSLLKEDERLEFKKNISLLTTNKPLIEYEQHFFDNEGKEHWIKWIDRALFDQQSNIVEYQSVGMDFTNLKQTELLLEEQKSRLDAVFENSLMGICVMSAQGNLITSNQRLAEMLGFTSINDFIGKNYFDFIANSNVYDDIKENFETVFSGSVSSFNIQRQYRSIDKKLFWGDIYITPITFLNGRATEAVGMVVDISMRKKAEEELKENEEKLRQLNLTKDKLFSVIAHDIRNPFNAILGFANILENSIEDLSTGEVKEFAHKIVNASEQTFKLLEDLLTWAKSQLGQLKVYKEPFHPSSILDECTNSLEALSKSKSINIETKVADGLILESDVTMFKFILRNLLHNAIKYSYTGNKVICTIEELDNENINLKVIDYGVGIKPKKLKKLFDLNELVSSRGTAEEKGTGLGLSMVKEMTELNGGYISVKSEVNEGSEFSVILPMH